MSEDDDLRQSFGISSDSTDDAQEPEEAVSGDADGDDEMDSSATKVAPQSASQPATSAEEPGVENADLLDPSDVSGLALPAGERTDEMFYDLPILADVSHPLTPSTTHDYIPRRIRGKKDLDLITFALAHPEFACLLEGDTGTGKDFSIIKICAETNRPIARVNFDLGTTIEDLVGGYAPKDTADDEIVQRVKALEENHDLSTGQAIELASGASTQFTWDDGLLTWCAKNGGVFLADEINAAGGEATMPLHGVTEQEGNRYLTLKEKGEVLTDLPVTDEEIDAATEAYRDEIEAVARADAENARSWAAHFARVDKWDHAVHYGRYIHPEFRFAATMNPPRYAGAKELNKAFKQRFFTIPVDYLPADGEVALLATATPFDGDDEAHERAMRKLADMGENLRQSYRGTDRDKDIATPIGHRLMIQIGIWMPKFGEQRNGEIDVAEGTQQAAKFVLVENAIEEDRAKIQKLIETTKFGADE